MLENACSRFPFLGLSPRCRQSNAHWPAHNAETPHFFFFFFAKYFQTSKAKVHRFTSVATTRVLVYPMQNNTIRNKHWLPSLRRTGLPNWALIFRLGKKPLFIQIKIKMFKPGSLVETGACQHRGRPMTWPMHILFEVQGVWGCPRRQPRRHGNSNWPLRWSMIRGEKTAAWRRQDPVRNKEDAQNDSHSQDKGHSALLNSLTYDLSPAPMSYCVQNAVIGFPTKLQLWQGIKRTKDSDVFVPLDGNMTQWCLQLWHLYSQHRDMRRIISRNQTQDRLFFAHSNLFFHISCRLRAHRFKTSFTTVRAPKQRWRLINVAICLALDWLSTYICEHCEADRKCQGGGKTAIPETHNLLKQEQVPKTISFEYHQVLPRHHNVLFGRLYRLRKSVCLSIMPRWTDNLFLI